MISHFGFIFFQTQYTAYKYEFCFWFISLHKINSAHSCYSKVDAYWVGVFDAHSAVWGIRIRYGNRIVLEDVLEKPGIVLDDRRTTWLG